MINKPFTTEQFVTGYKRNATDNLKENYIKTNLYIKSYLPIDDKLNMVGKIIKATMYRLDNSNSNYIYTDSVSRYILYVLMLINEYTNINIDFSKPNTEYDLLDEYGLVETIITALPKKETVECKTILDMKIADVTANEYETHAFISNQVTRFGNLIGAAGAPYIEKLKDTIANMDDEQIEKISNKLTKAFAKIVK